MYRHFPLRATHSAAPVLGLDAYDQDGDLMLSPLKFMPRAGIWCANGKYPKQSALGYCRAKNHTNWGLNLYLIHQQALLPQRQEVNAKTVALINSFLVNP